MTDYFGWVVTSTVMVMGVLAATAIIIMEITDDTHNAWSDWVILRAIPTLFGVLLIEVVVMMIIST